MFEEALYLSTPVLYAQYKKHAAAPLTDAKALRKLHLSLYKYHSRAVSRCTPFGLFAGPGVGEWKNENCIVLDADLQQSLVRKTRPDMNVVCALAQELARQQYILPYLKFYPNSSLYKAGDYYRYVEYAYKGNSRQHKLTRVEHSPYLEKILLQARAGLTHAELAGLITDNEITHEEAAMFIDDIIAAQLLVSQLEPVVTGPDYFDVLIAGLNDICALHPAPRLAEVCALLGEVRSMIRSTDTHLFNAPGTYEAILVKLSALLPELQETNLLQTDLYKYARQADLSKDIRQNIVLAMKFLDRIMPPVVNGNLEEFRKRFSARYEDYEVPLLLALDAETGIGYPPGKASGVNELADDIVASHSAGESEIKWGRLHTCLLTLITNAAACGEKILKLTEKDFDQVNFSGGKLPLTCAVMFKVLDAQSGKIALRSIGGSSAVNLVGRFSAGHPEIEKLAGRIAAFEQEKMQDRIMAEIVHLPESRTGNILARARFRNYEIPYLAGSSVPDDFRVKVQDLYIKVREGKVILFDRRLNKEIIPRMGNAHNYAVNSLPVYHFLCDLQSQYFQRPYLGFSWQVFAEQLAFLPRVEYKETVLCPARWRLSESDLMPLRNSKLTDAQKRSLFAEIKKQHMLPDEFLLTESDNELLIDCRDDLSVDAFIDAVKNRSEAILEEYLFDPRTALIRDTEGNSFHNECIAVMYNDDESYAAALPASAPQQEGSGLFCPGSEWLYYKIYCGPKTADDLLAGSILPLTQQLLAEKRIDRWFFIRYADPGAHLRLRLHTTHPNEYGPVAQRLSGMLQPLLEQNVISGVQAETYRRELDRYGSNTIEDVEELFYHDSVFAVGLLDLLDAGEETLRWQAALRSADELLSDFGVQLKDRHGLLEAMRAGFFEEHGGGKELKLQLDNKYRKLRGKIEEILPGKMQEEKEYLPVTDLLAGRSRMNKPVIKRLLQLEQEGRLQVPLRGLLTSLLHMNMNRLFMSRGRTNELVAYDLLSRHYKSMLAKRKNGAGGRLSAAENKVKAA